MCIFCVCLCVRVSFLFTSLWVSCVFFLFFYVHYLRRGLAFCIFLFFLSFPSFFRSFYLIYNFCHDPFDFVVFCFVLCLLLEMFLFVQNTQKKSTHIPFNSLLIWLNTIFLLSIVYWKRHHHTQNVVHTLNIFLSLSLTLFRFSVSFVLCLIHSLSRSLYFISSFFPFFRRMSHKDDDDDDYCCYYDCIFFTIFFSTLFHT